MTHNDACTPLSLSRAREKVQWEIGVTACHGVIGNRDLSGPENPILLMHKFSPRPVGARESLEMEGPPPGLAGAAEPGLPPVKTQGHNLLSSTAGHSLGGTCNGAS